MIYLDYNATTPVDSRVASAMMDVYTNHPGNAGSRTHLLGDDCRAIVEDARRKIASLAKVDTSEVVFTSGATESDNIAILGLSEYGLSHGRRHVLVSSIEHKAVLSAAEELSRCGFEVEKIPVGADGAINAQDALNRIRNDTLLVSVMHVNNETGVIQPVKEIGEQIALSYPGVFFHIDAAQSFGKMVEEVASLSYDMLSLTAHKMYGPQGIGALIIRRKDFVLPPVRPLLFGGGQEKGISPGTQPVALIAGFGEAAELCLAEWACDYSREAKIKASLVDAISGSDVSHHINGDPKRSVPTCLNVSFDGVSSEALMVAVKQGVCISNGSACTSSSYEPSYVLTSMGLGADRAESAIRLSWGRMTDPDAALDAINRLIKAASDLQG